MNELNNKIRHTLGWCLYTPLEKECQHLPANEDDEQTILELSALFTEQIRLGSETAKDFQWRLDRQLDMERVDKMLYSINEKFAPSLEEQLRKWSIELHKQLKPTTDTTLLEGEQK